MVQKEITMNPLRPDRIIRSRRRTISLEITRDAVLVVRAPLRTTEAYIGSLIEQKRAWIEKKMAEMKGQPAPGKRRFVQGEEFLFLGKFYSLEILAGSDAGISLGDRLYIGEERLPECRRLLIAWYTEKAAAILPARVAGVAAILDYRPKRSGSRIPGGAGPRAARQAPSPSAGVSYLPRPKSSIT